MKKATSLFLSFLLLVTVIAGGSAHAQFVPGQVLTAQQLNAAFQSAALNSLPIAGGTLKGPISGTTASFASGAFSTLAATGAATLPNAQITGGSISGLSSPIGFGSGGTGATTALGATANLQFLQGATGAVARTALAKLQDSVNVRDYGAKCDGTTDDTAAIQAAVNSLGVGGKLNFPAGWCNVSQIVVNTAQVVLEGAGPFGSGTYLRALSATSDVLVIKSSGAVVRDISFGSTVTRTGGAFILCDTTSSQVTIQDVAMDSWYYGIRLTAAGGPFFLGNITMRNGVPGIGQAVRVENGTDVTMFYVVVVNPTNAAGRAYAGLVVTGSSDVTVLDCQFQWNNYGMMLTPGANQVIASVYAVNSFFDNSGVDGVLIQPMASNSAVTRVRIEGSWASSSGEAGVRIDNSNTTGSGGVDGVELIGNEYFANASGVILNLTGTGNGNVDILGGKMAGNTNAGIAVFNVQSGLKIVGSRIGPTGAFAGNRYGIQIATGATLGGLVVNSNDLSGNTSAPFANGSTSTNIVIKGNLGYNPIASTTISVAASPFSWTNNTGDTVNVLISGGTVSAVTLGGTQVAASSNSVVPVPQGASVAVTYSSAPTMSYLGN